MPTPTGNENINGALITGQNICWDETHGYNRFQGTRELNPDVDCSYFVGYCLSQNGFNVSPGWYTGSMITDLSNYQGFAHYIWDSSFIWQNGDIAVYDEGGGAHGHTFFYAENILGYTSQTDPTIITLARARIEASGSRGHYINNDPNYPVPGDQDNGYGVHDEVWVHPFSDPDASHVWHIFRWNGATPPHPILTAEKIGIISKRKRVVVENPNMRGGWKDFYLIRKRK